MSSRSSAADEARDGELEVDEEQEAADQQANLRTSLGLLRSQESGKQLPGGLRDELEGALGTDLSPVRLHQDGESTRAAAQLGKQAFAMGNDIHLGAELGELSKPEGRHLVAHEVAHTVQHDGKAGEPVVGARGSSAEGEAGRFADAFLLGSAQAGMVTAGGGGDAAIHGYDRDEHHDLPTKDLKELYAFLATPEGETWAKQHGYDAKNLRAKMKNDPVIQNKKLHGSANSNPGGAPTEYDYGEPTALMGDLYGKWKQLYDASPDEKTKLMHAKSTSEYQKVSHGRYLALARKNGSHFAVENRKAWLDHHNQAIALAKQAGQSGDAEQLNQALFIEAAGEHFLTDAFSAGHLFERSKVYGAVLLDLQKKPLKTENPQMQTYAGIPGDSDLGLMIVKLIHDILNESGFTVTNNKGMKWNTYGDGNLARAPETQRIAALATFEARQQILEAQKGAEPKRGDILDFFPDDQTVMNAELVAIALIPEARKKVAELIYKERGSAPDIMGDRMASFGKKQLGKIGLGHAGKVAGKYLGKGIGYIVERNLDTIGDPGRQRELELDEELDRAAGHDDGPQVRSSITLKRF